MLRVLYVVLLCCAMLPATSTHAAAPQLRALWVDAFHDGIKTPAQTQTLIHDAERMGANALFVQVRRRADSYYRDSLEPFASTGTQPDMAAGYDPLADLITQAHARNIQVHAWVVTLPAWKINYTQPDGQHVWYQHGPHSSDNWMMLDQNGQVGDCAENCSLDPGHPAAAAYVVNVLRHLAARYDLDGVQLDYVRYPSPAYGYNAVSLQRFHEATGRTDRPAPTNAQWLQWRRDQVTALVKRVYLELHALKPHLVVSAATITWGEAPTTDFTTSRAYNEVLQNWAGWLDQGYLDMAVLMNYYDEGTPTFADRFTAWTQFARTHPGRRAVAIGLGAWRNTTDQTIQQVARATPGTLGVSFYSYALPTADDRAAFWDRIAAYYGHDHAPAPTLPWLATPTHGHLLGQVRFDGVAASNQTVYAVGPDGSTATTTTDGNGVWGMVDLAPGRYTLTVRDPHNGDVHTATAEVVAGAVTSLVLPPPDFRYHTLVPVFTMD